MAQEVPLILQESSFRIQFDGSPWGGGALLLQGSQPIEYSSVAWDEGILRRFGATLGDSRWQSVWEFVTLLLSLLLWGHLSAESLLCILGDNIAALQFALTLKGRGHMLTISRDQLHAYIKPLHSSHAFCYKCNGGTYHLTRRS